MTTSQHVWWTNLPQYPFQDKLHSQNGETVILKNLFEHFGTVNNYLVDIGAGDGEHISNTHYFMHNGWDGLRIDGKIPDNKSDVKQHFVTLDNIHSIFEQHEVPEEFDLLDVDIDGNDYWILDAILKNYSPRIVIAEFNGCIPEGESKTIKYDSNFVHAADDYYGFSFEAGKKLMKQHGYTLVYQLLAVNMFFVRTDLLDGVEDMGVTYTRNQYHPPTQRTDVDWVAI